VDPLQELGEDIGDIWFFTANNVLDFNVILDIFALLRPSPFFPFCVCTLVKKDKISK
jgi:hypothetical protein